MSKYPCAEPREAIENPDPKDLRQFAADMPTARETEYGNLNIKTTVLARSKASTYIATDTPDEHTDQCISRADADNIAKAQDDYIKGCDMIVIDGFIGGDPEHKTPARLMMEKSHANIAAMQRQLYFDPSPSEFNNFSPELHVIYTPGLKAEGYPNDRVISVDLQNNVTRVLNSDYFGESKKGGLRMWNKRVYDMGGLPMHAGCKIIPTSDGPKVALIIGLSGTGKTTTTFTQQNGSQPVQDDFVGLLPGGKVLATEDGCFAKTYGLSAETEPEIYNAVVTPTAYLENVYQDGKKLDFFNESYTANGRATFPFSLIPNSGDARTIGKVDFVLILNRNDNIIPAVSRLSVEQAAAYFMLGETQGTSAGGVEEAGKALRVPGTNPFFPLRHGLQGTRFLELLRGMPDTQVFLLNTGWVGGPKGHEDSHKVKIRHSSAVVKGIAEGSIEFGRDDDFGYEVASKVPGLDGDDELLLRPKELFDKKGRQGEYQKFVQGYKEGRAAHLKKYPSVSDEIVSAVA